ncbi:FAD-dependent oxidoreductase [Aestuariibacter sp. AA17]|uniref:FAD-dependent oxidoreductase n=1 Tax=Fluctibacter corallii TaxID=2984329 RepID=A0ABT3AB81_9ALTE|nr:FAD-dependent oxidoreductase [Aestuariibacter sp. AA17]MCV2885927.1 FAD-dependent oxidoreductase [Aestuariibacter sp. AA17]
MIDVCVIGGGMVGAATALGLAKAGYSVLIVENAMPAPFDSESEPDLRVSAINMASVNLLTELGAWSEIEAMRLHPYDSLAVWEMPTSKTVFNAKDIQAPCLGYFVENRILQLGIHQALACCDNVTWKQHVAVTSITLSDESSIQFSDGEAITCKWVIGADGGHSATRQLVGIGVTGWQYQQHAMGIKIKQSHSQSITWQQFTPTGPVAFLPLSDGYASLIWYHNAEHLQALKGVSPEVMKSRILDAFPDLGGDFDVLEWAAFPLVRQHANRYIDTHFALVGDAAHMINPLAGQGVNLGFKDVAELLKQCSKLGMTQRALAAYERSRKPQNLLMMSTMDVFYSVFSNAITPVKVIRNLGLSLADKAGPIKNQVLRYAMGY